MRIAILDSGVRTNHPAFIGKNIDGFSISVDDDGNIVKSEDFDDKIGHGTAIYYLINKLAPNSQIMTIKIYDTFNDIDQNRFEIILDYIKRKTKFDIINISMGIVMCGNTANMQKICDEIANNGTVIVSAFDNNGAVSFPAALENVVGVDGQKNITNKSNYILIHNNIVNVIGKIKNQKVAWLEPDYILIGGNSFICAEVSAQIANTKSYEIIDKLREFCGTENAFDLPIKNSLPFKICNAAVFPFNKEIHALARNEALLNFNVSGYYDVRIAGRVGKKISSILPDCSNDKKIINIDDIGWSDFDTLILGHTNELTDIVKIDYKNILIEKAIYENKNIYLFDNYNIKNFEKYKKYKNLFCPIITEQNVYKRFGKLYKTDKPILSIIGTNSKQGKFTLQLMLRKMLIDLGYNVGQIGTEPSSLLFGMDEIFADGYYGEVALSPQQICSVTNKMIRDISQKDVDIIITGCQSGLVAYNDRNIDFIPFNHQIYFESMQPDAIIMCINEYDDCYFVEKTIKAAEGLSNAKVIGLVCFPLSNSKGWVGTFGGKSRISTEREKELKDEFLLKLNQKVYMLDRKNEINDLLNECLNYFQ